MLSDTKASKTIDLKNPIFIVKKKQYLFVMVKVVYTTHTNLLLIPVQLTYLQQKRNIILLLLFNIARINS